MCVECEKCVECERWVECEEWEYNVKSVCSLRGV